MTCTAADCDRPPKALGMCDTHYRQARRPRPATPSTGDLASRQMPAIVELEPTLSALLGPSLPARAACAGRAPLHDDEIEGETAADRADRLAYALAVCATCPALAPCAAAAEDLPHAQRRGVWGGVLHTRAPSGRPPTVAVAAAAAEVSA